MIPRAELQPGSSEPSGPAEIDDLLTAVPELAFLPEFETCVPIVDSSSEPSHDEVDARMSDTRRIAAALRVLGETATSQSNGGLAFLVRTLLHFIDVQRVPASQHPLIVALYLRGSARARGNDATPASIAAAMDLWT